MYPTDVITKNCHTFAFVPFPNPFPMLARLFPNNTSRKSFKKHTLRVYPWVFLVQHADIHNFPHYNPWMPSKFVKNKIILCFWEGFSVELIFVVGKSPCGQVDLPSDSRPLILRQKDENGH
jgi:hypothetical protein